MDWTIRFQATRATAAVHASACYDSPVCALQSAAIARANFLQRGDVRDIDVIRHIHTRCKHRDLRVVRPSLLICAHLRGDRARRHQRVPPAQIVRRQLPRHRPERHAIERERNERPHLSRPPHQRFVLRRRELLIRRQQRRRQPVRRRRQPRGVRLPNIPTRARREQQPKHHRQLTIILVLREHQIFDRVRRDGRPSSSF